MSYTKIQADLFGSQHDLMWPASDGETLKVIMDDWNEGTAIINKYVIQGRTVIQAGGHAGLYPLMYSKFFERVFTFEPDLINFTCLSNNCDDTRIIKINAAVGEKHEFVSMGIVSYQNTGMNKVLPKGVDGIIAYCVPIDSFNIQNVDLIHLDVEGYEYQAVRGARKTIAKNKPTVVLEMPLQEKQHKIYSLMESIDYVEVDKYGSGKCFNSIFVSKEKLT